MELRNPCIIQNANLCHTVHSLLFKKEFDPAERVLLYSQLREGLITENIKVLESLSAAKLKQVITREGLLHQYKNESATRYGSRLFANAPKLRLVDFLKDKVMSETDSSGNIRLINAPGGIEMYFGESDIDEILTRRYGEDYRNQVEEHMSGFDPVLQELRQVP